MLRLLLGVRDDLELETRWWHRLARVALILSAMCIGAAGWWAAQQLSEPHPHVGNIQYVSLEDFRHRQPKEATNITGQFGALPGTLGLLQEDGSVRELWLSELQRDLYWSQDIYAHIGEYVDWERGHKGPTDPDPTVDTATAELQTMGLKLGESTCLGPASSKIY